MERSLDLSLLTAALGGRTGIPSAEELQELMARMEVQLFLRRPELDPNLLSAAWYLHGVASVDNARDRYTPERQRQAFAVSAHIFDLALQQGGWRSAERLSMGFAAAIGYRRGGRDPNATAILNRLRDLIVLDPPVAAHIDTLPLEVGLAFVGFDTRKLFAWFRTWRTQLHALARESAVQDLSSTVFGPGQLIVLGADDLLEYFTSGDVAMLARGRARLLRVINVDDVPEDVHARWVAAHLHALADEAGAGSLWNPEVIPPGVPPLVRRSFTLGNPPVLTLWEPQRDLLTGGRSPFDPSVRRMVLAVPTSGGKTLLAQLLAVEQLERTGRGVCYVAPTRSLCREVRQAMSSRVRILQKETGTDMPDFASGLSGVLDSLDYLDAGHPADVEVMTPERLANLLRHDATSVLLRFGMFIFDEAQFVKEAGRGFVLESTIAMLDYLTRNTEHRLVLISAAMGNAGAIASWISRSGQAPLLHESAWRGPRRLHAVFTTEAKWDQTRIQQNPRARRWRFIHSTELTGLIRLRLADGNTARLTTTEDTGWRLVRKATSSDPHPSEAMADETSTRQYKIAADMTRLLGHAGSVLIVTTTREQARQIAESLAEAGTEEPALAATVDFVRGQLGADHPLVKTLRGGAGFHHAGLPTDVQEALEQAVRDDALPYLACTSTLTDGVNLPVRTVVIYDTTYEGQPEDARLRGARLVNAIGRAGRAGKETEGWIVLTRAAKPKDSDFTDLDPDADTLAVISSLIDDRVLHELAALEEQLRTDEDAIFHVGGKASISFISFVWLMLAVEEERGNAPGAVDVDDIVDSTLAALQSATARSSLRRVGRTVKSRYQAADPTARRRWARTGTGVGSARAIDDLAGRIVETIVSRARRGEDDDLSDPGFLLQYPTIIKALMELPEAPPWRFRTTTRGDDIDTEPTAVLHDWLHGVALSQLAETHLAAAAPASWRIEQMVDAVTSHFEHYLSWTVGAVVELANLRLGEAGVSKQLCPELGGYIRYGVDHPSALILMTSGIRSRRLAHSVARDVPEDMPISADNLRGYVARIGVAGWRDRYHATASEILDLLEFARLRRRSLLRTLLEEGTVEVELAELGRGGKYRRLTVEPHRESPEPAPLAVYDGDELIATIASQDHVDVNEIINTGIEASLGIEVAAASPTLTVTLSPRQPY